MIDKQLIQQYEANLDERQELLKLLMAEFKGYTQSVVKLLATTLKTEIAIHFRGNDGGGELQIVLTIGTISKVSEPLPIELVVSLKGQNYIKGEMFNLVGQIMRSYGDG